MNALYDVVSYSIQRHTSYIKTPQFIFALFDEVSLLFQKRTTLIQKLKKDPGNLETLKDKEEVEEKLALIVGKENREKIFQNFAKLDQSEGESFSQGIWDLKKKVFPKVQKAVPAAKRDTTGRVI